MPSATRELLTSRRRYLMGLALLLSALTATLYLGWTAAAGRLGFPLDDGWIHQTYARNLAHTGQMAYLPEQPSAGSTSPLWTILLSVGYLLRLDYRLWTYLLGALCLSLTAWAAYRLAGHLFPDQPWVAPLTGFLCALEWHLAWAAFSGMETILFTWLLLLLINVQFSICKSQGANHKAQITNHKSQITNRSSQFAIAGVVAGLLTLTRPEGVLLVGLVGLALLWHAWRTMRWRGILAVGGYGLAFAAVVSPWLVFNLRVSGQPFPNTFYAKQAEYSIYLGLPIWTRLARVLQQPLTGAQLLLIPGLCYAVLRLRRTPHSPPPTIYSLLPTLYYLLPSLWWLLTVLVYALRLPVNYQHGRYVIPTIPVLILYGTGGTLRLLRSASTRMTLRVLSRSLLLATVVLLLAFWVLGARQYAVDTGFIEGEMVAVAHWLNANTEPDALIAVHDIGAVGYFIQRPLLDLAGLITPEVVPFIADETRLLTFMAEQGADYVIFFPDWSDAYRRMAGDPQLHPVYSTDYAWTRNQGRENMVVFETEWQ
jgi:arabinofuranosyltransferase